MQDTIEFDSPEDDEDDQEFDVDVLHQICQDDKARRELIWARHMYKGDYVNAYDMEQVDPNLRARLRNTTARVWKAVRLDPRDPDRSGSMKDVYERIYDERWRHHSAFYAAKTCRCIDCDPNRIPLRGDGLDLQPNEVLTPPAPCGEGNRDS